MPPNPSSPQNPPAAEASPRAGESGLTRREWLGTLGVGLGLAAVAVGLGWWTGRRGRGRTGAASPGARALVDFTLIERSGRTVSREELRGRLLVVSFLFTSCSLSCRAVNDRMAELQRALAGTEDVRLISITVDPRTDTPEALARFAARYHADPDRWLFLTGEKAEVYRLIETSFLSRTRELEALIPGGFANLDHLAVVDRAGRVRDLVNGLRPGAVAQILVALERLRRESDTR
jgi:cytochrome oxidase Cu insertion factor (SCO1/SenC/PrrC family)